MLKESQREVFTAEIKTLGFLGRVFHSSSSIFLLFIIPAALSGLGKKFTSFWWTKERRVSKKKSNFKKSQALLESPNVFVKLLTQMNVLIFRKRDNRAFLSTELWICFLFVWNFLVYVVRASLVYFDSTMFFFPGYAELKWDGLVALYLKNLWNFIKYISNDRWTRGSEILNASVSISSTFLYLVRNWYFFLRA